MTSVELAGRGTQDEESLAQLNVNKGRERDLHCDDLTVNIPSVVTVEVVKDTLI